ncbi:hypothetical protein VXD82_00330, partial [Mycobacteroides chelonae]
NQDGSYNRAANGEQQPINYTNAPNNQGVSQDWQQLSDQLNSPQNQQGPDKNQSPNQDEQQSDQCHGPYDWGSKAPTSHLMQSGAADGRQTLGQTPSGEQGLTDAQQRLNDMVDEVQRLLSLSPTLVNMWQEIAADPTDIGLIHRYLLYRQDGRYISKENPSRNAGGYTNRSNPERDLDDQGVNIRIATSSLNDPIWLARFLIHEMANAKYTHEGAEDERGLEYIEAKSLLLAAQVQEEIAANCGGSDIVEGAGPIEGVPDVKDPAMRYDNEKFHKWLREVMHAVRDNRITYEDAITQVGQEWGEHFNCIGVDGSQLTIRESYRGKSCKV